MNCAECRDNLVACAEGLLERDAMLELRAHLETCADCAAEYRAVTNLRQRLVVRGQATADVSIVGSVMRRVLQEKKEKESIMSKLFEYRWGFGLGAAASAVAIILIAFLIFPKAQVTAAEVMARGAQAVAKLTSIHFRGELRTLPGDNFSFIDADCPFYPIELWKQFEPDLKWRIEKPLRVAVMNGKSTVMLIKNGDVASRSPQPAAFGTEWLQRIANLSSTITNELNNALAKGWKLSLNDKTGTDGRPKSIVTIMANPGVPENDYLKNSSMGNADTRRVYCFDSQSELLESVQIYLERPSGEVKIFDLSQIDYNQPIDPSTWKLDLPADVSWAQLSQNAPVLPDNQKYASMTAEQAARAFFEACSREDWDEAGKFYSPVNQRLKDDLSGLEIISLGQSFTSTTYVGRFVPYEIKLKNGHVEKWNLVLRKDNPAGRWQVDGGI